MFCGLFKIPSMRSVLMLSTGLFFIQFCIQLSVLSFRLPFFKLSFSLFRFKECLNCGQQCSCERVDLIIRYARRVLFLSRHSPLLCILSDTIPPFHRLFSCQFNSRNIKVIVCTSKSAGVAQNINLRTPWTSFISSRSRSISFAVDLSCSFISDSVSSTCSSACAFASATVRPISLFMV